MLCIAIALTFTPAASAGDDIVVDVYDTWVLIHGTTCSVLPYRTIVPDASLPVGGELGEVLNDAADAPRSPRAFCYSLS